jgi:hypothetical protein
VGAPDCSEYGTTADVRGFKIAAGDCIGGAIFCSDMSKEKIFS